MRKPRRLSVEELAPYVWEPEGPHARPGGPSEAPPAPPPRIDWAALFGNDLPIEVEVGMGKGLFLLTSALARPEANFFGIEIDRKYQLYAATRVAVRRLPNAKTACADAHFVLRDCVRPASVAAVHVYFPDPWWKQRHRKRRVFTAAFAASVAAALRPGGRLRIATDVEEYFGVIAALVRAMPAFRELPPADDRTLAPGADYETNFERKARMKGIAIHRVDFQRT